jgi:hypothetical protein
VFLFFSFRERNNKKNSQSKSDLDELQSYSLKLLIRFAKSCGVFLRSISIGSISDLNMGQKVMVNGKTNPDGSIAAQNIQIRPAMINEATSQ